MAKVLLPRKVSGRRYCYFFKDPEYPLDYFPKTTSLSKPKVQLKNNLFVGKTCCASPQNLARTTWWSFPFQYIFIQYLTDFRLDLKKIETCYGKLTCRNIFIFQKYPITQEVLRKDRPDGSGMQEYGTVSNPQSVKLNVLPAAVIQLFY